MSLRFRQIFNVNNMNKEELLLTKRFLDLSRQAQHKGIVTFSEFLNLNELNIFNQIVPELFCSYELSGGYEFSERQMVAFIPDALSVFVYPIVCLKIQPKNKKFTDQLNHRDVLGSIMNLGIERGKIGDILMDHPDAYVFCSEHIAVYLSSELTRIKHTSVKMTQMESIDLNIQPDILKKDGIIASNRLDCVIACMLNLSRKDASLLIKKGSVFVYNKEITNTSAACKINDLISIRSYGRFRFVGEINETKKGRIKIQYEVFK